MATRQFTLRISTDVYNQVCARARVLNRSTNKEIESLLAWAIDRQAEVDEATLAKVREHLSGSRKDLSETAIALGLNDRPV